MTSHRDGPGPVPSVSDSPYCKTQLPPAATSAFLTSSRNLLISPRNFLIS